MITANRLIGAALVPALMVLFAEARTASADDRMLFDFKDEASVKAWSNLDVYAMREAEAKAKYDAAAKASKDPAKLPAYKPLAQPAKEPPVKIEWTADGASRGKHAMKLTFAGGRMPTVGAKSPIDDWKTYRAFRATVTAPRPCMVVFRVMAETSRYGVTSWDDTVSRWEFAARCGAGRNALVMPAPRDVAQRWNKVRSLEIYLYNPHEGESLVIDSISLSTDRPDATSPFHDTFNETVVPAGGYRVLGTELVVKDVDDLADKLKDQWVKPADKGVAEIEADVRAEYEKIKAAHPKAVLVTLRDGDKGSDPANPDKLFTGWMDAGTPGHEPLVVVLTNFGNTGRDGSIKTWFRSHPALLRVDLSSLPKGAEILAARLIVVRGYNAGNNWETKPTMFVVEPVRRPWNEYEVNVFEYAKDAVWSDYGAQSWGEDGDCDAVMLAHGPIAGKTLSLDFTEAVKYWTSGQHENHGFILYGALDRLSIATRESGNVSNRPGVMVIYEPKREAMARHRGAAACGDRGIFPKRRERGRDSGKRLRNGRNQDYKKTKCLGPLSTARLEMMREGVQECEARIFLEETLLDEGKQEKLGETLAGRCRAALNERTLAVERCFDGSGSAGAQLGLRWYLASGWRQRSGELYALAAEVAQKLETLEK